MFGFLSFLLPIWSFLKKLPWQWIVIPLLAIGVYLAGYSKGVDASEVRIAQYKQEVATLSNNILRVQHTVDEKVITKFVDRTTEIAKAAVENKDQATTVVVARKDNVSNGFVEVHDAASAGVVADRSKAADGTPSPYSDNQVLGTVTDNYAICKANEEQLRALQEWVAETKKNIDSQNAAGTKKKKK